MNHMKKYYTVKEAAEKANIIVQEIYRAIHSKNLRVYGKKPYFMVREDQLEKWISDFIDRRSKRNSFT